MISRNHTPQDAELAFYRAFELADLYLLTDRGWRMMVYHASALASVPTPQDAPSVLH